MLSSEPYSSTAFSGSSRFSVIAETSHFSGGTTPIERGGSEHGRRKCGVGRELGESFTAGLPLPGTLAHRCSAFLRAECAVGRKPVLRGSRGCPGSHRAGVLVAPGWGDEALRAGCKPGPAGGEGQESAPSVGRPR